MAQTAELALHAPASLRALATRSLSTLLVALNALGLAGLGVSLALDPPAYSDPLGMRAAGACWAIAAGGATTYRLLALRPRVPAALLAAIPVVMSLAALGSLAFLRTDAHLRGPWPSELQAGAIVTVTLVGTLGLRWGAVGTLLVAGAAMQVATTGRIPDSVARGPLLTALPLTMLLIMTATAAVLMGLLRQSALRLDGQLRTLDARLALAEAAASAEGFAAEVTRSLHDSALNTLEAITLSGPYIPTDLVRRRASADARAIGDWLAASVSRPLDHLADDLVAHAARLGIAVRWERWNLPEDTSLIPAQVVGALRGAAKEALTNVAKHAGVTAATASLEVSADGGVALRITDAGLGVNGAGRGVNGAQPSARLGFGTTESIEGRMAAVGGTGQVLPGAAGGTTVILSWSPTVASAEPSAAPVLLQLGGQAVAVVTIGAGLLSAALTVLVPGSFRSPAPAVLASLLVSAIAGFVSFGPAGWRAQNRAGQCVRANSDTAVVLLTYLCGFALMLQADPLCVSVLTLPLAPHPGILLLIALVMWDPRRTTAALALATVAAGHLGTLLLPGATGCTLNSTSDGLVAVSALLVFALFSRTTLRLGHAHAISRRLSRELAIQTHRAVLLRAERTEWLAEAIGRSQALLNRLANGDASPSDPDVRRECHREAALLRAILVVGSATPDNRRHLRCQLNRIVEGGHVLAAKGDFRELDPPVHVIDELREWARAAGRAVEVPLQVTLFAWSAGAEQGLNVLAEPISEGAVTGLEPELSWEWVTTAGMIPSPSALETPLALVAESGSRGLVAP